MNTASRINSPLLWTLSLLVGAAFALLAHFTLDVSAFGDTDPLWHIAAGELIRASGIPATDPWSFTAGNTAWFNISWAWDALASYLHAKFGWHGVFVLNSWSIGLAAALIFAGCFLRSQNGIAAFLSTSGALTLLYLSARPQQITQIMVALWMLILAQVAHGHMRTRWLALLPLSMIFWVNMHGGFLLGPFLIAAFFLHALYEKNANTARAFFLCGVASTLAIFCNAYGFAIFEATLRTLSTDADAFIHEWQPFAFTFNNILHCTYAVIFVLCVGYRALPVLNVERALAWFWLALGLLTVRYLSIFAIIAAPLIACWFATFLTPKTSPTPRAARINKMLLRITSHQAVAFSAALLVLFIAIGTFANSPKHPITFPLTLQPEIAYLEKHYPKGRFLNEYMLGSLLIDETRGRIPVFIDPRAETAYPSSVVQDYITFINHSPSWEGIVGKYKLTGALFSRNEQEKIQFLESAGWQKAFSGPLAVILLAPQ